MTAAGRRESGRAVRIAAARTRRCTDAARRLFRAYVAELGVDLGFQDFEAELAGLPGEYAPPSGRLLLAWDGDEAVGCVALRRLRGAQCEMKRMYVQPVYRGSGAGRALAARVLADARAIGYRSMVLDTLPRLVAAIALYESLGFRRRDGYYATPLADTVFMERTL